VNHVDTHPIRDPGLAAQLLARLERPPARRVPKPAACPAPAPKDVTAPRPRERPRQDWAGVTVRYECPICRGPHARADHSEGA
jgi:hypothetical protein